jgi:broad specificity phosphatase PhoE
MRSLFFIGRHGETALNEKGMYRGWSNGPDAQLSKQGIESAHEAAKFLVSLKQPFSRIICSPLGRSQTTAAIIAEYFGITELFLDERLRPLNVGNFAGTKKSENKIEPFLVNKNKRFPGGETVAEFEHRQYEFAREVLSYIDTEKSSDHELLVIAHVSNVMYWWNVQTGANSDEYLGEKSDIVLPGGIALITENTTIPIFKPNSDCVGIAETNPINQNAIKGEPGTGYESGKKGSFNCSNCEYFKDSSCGQEDMMSKSKRPRTKDGRVKVEADGCCEFVDRLGEEKP